MGQHTSKQTTEYFLKPLRDDHIDVIFEHAQPELVNNADREIYRAVMNNYRTFLGAFEKTNDQKYKRTFEVNGESTTLVESSEIFFTNGVLRWNVEWRDNKLAVMNAVVPNMAKREPSHNIESFVQRGVTFIRHFFANDALEFSDLMSPAVAKVVPPPEASRIPDLKIDHTELGGFVDVKPRDVPNLETIPATDAGKTFTITYEIEHEKAQGRGTVTFAVDEYKSSLMSFSFCQQLIRSQTHPEPDVGVTSTKTAVQYMIKFDAKEYPDVLKCHWGVVLADLDPLEEHYVASLTTKAFPYSSPQTVLSSAEPNILPSSPSQVPLPPHGFLDEPECQYPILDDDSDSEVDAPVPTWTHEENLSKGLEIQTTVNPDEIFGEGCGKNIDLKAIFGPSTTGRRAKK